MTKILCLSDTHGILPDLDLNGIDLVLFAGDFSSRSRDDIYRQLNDFNNYFCPWVRDILKKTQFYYINGNHEVFSERIPLNYYANDITCRNIDNKLINFNGINIYGFPWTNRFFDWAWNTEDIPEDMGAKADLIPARTDIVLSHGPVYGINDKIYKNKSIYIHGGSKYLYERINKIKPKLFISGHLHDDSNYGIVEHEGIKYVGVSQMNENYENVRNPVILEI